MQPVRVRMWIALLNHVLEVLLGDLAIRMFGQKVFIVLVDLKQKEGSQVLTKIAKTPGSCSPT